ncbi:hypothetical protein A2U01_0083709, partial [Trifolium medium]|nr:hypothetical protein [Trifolium medium]
LELLQNKVVVRLARSATASETQRDQTNSLHPPGEKQRASSLRVTSARSATTQEHARSLQLAARLAHRPCLS